MMKLDFKKITFVFAVAAVAGCCDCDKPLRMVTEATFPPYEYVRGHEIVGVDVEICKAVAKKLGRPFKCETTDFDTVLPLIVGGRADIAASGLTITEDRKKEVDFSIPYVKTGIVVVFKKSRPYAKNEDLKGKKVGVQGGSTSEAYVLERLGQEPARFASPLAAVAALKAGIVDFVIADLEPAKHAVKDDADLALSDYLTSEEYGVAIRKGQPELLKVINETIAEVKANGKLNTWLIAYKAESDHMDLTEK
jgi:ABC-type amino acid transport substrate-binding protein